MSIEQQILRLEIAVYDVVRVQIVQRERDFGGIELGDRVRESLGLAKQTEQFSAFDEIHDHVQILRVLERAPQRDQEWVFDLLQHPPLVVGVLDLLHLDHLALFKDLDGIETLIMLGLDQMDSSETSGTQGTLDSKIDQRVFALCFPDGVLRWLEGCPA